jgi:hypothetical protein
MPPSAMTVIANAIARPSAHANRLGFADTHSGGYPAVIPRAITRGSRPRAPDADKEPAR